MKDADSRRIATIVRVSEFGKTWQLDTPPYGAVLKKLHAAAERLQWLAAEQQNAHSQWVAESHALDLLRIELRKKYLIKYARIGMDVFDGVADAKRAFTVPGARATASALADFADAMAKFIQRDVQRFLDQQQPADFLDRMRETAKALRVQQGLIEESIARQKGATAAITKEVPAARKDVDILDALLEARLSEDVIFATRWNKAKRLGKRMGPPRNRKWSWRRKKFRPK